MATAIVLAAGLGARMGPGEPKGLRRIGGDSGPTLLELAVLSAAAASTIEAVVVAVPPGSEGEGEMLAALAAEPVPLAVIAGGDTRQASVRRSLEEVAEGVGTVVVHDAARCFATPRLFDAVVWALDDDPTSSGAISVVPIADTVKRIHDGVVVETIDRDELAAVQTPQAFRVDALRRAHARAVEDGVVGTDDSVLLERIGERVVTVQGEFGNFKITTVEDLERAETVIRGERDG